MPADSVALLNLAPLLSHAPGGASEVEAEGDLVPTAEELAKDGLRLAGPLAWRVVVRNTGGDDDLIAEGEVEGTALMECRRCLEDVPTDVHASFLYPMVYKPSQEADLALVEAPLVNVEDDLAPHDELAEDRLSVGSPEVDFAPLLAQVFAIDLPLTALCSPSCRGLATDGTNLNEHPDHVPADAPEPEAPSSPFDVLADLDVESSS
jgi:uncharacterized protein